MSSYSKAPWGLSVLSQVTRIFTGITISPSPSSRQCPDRYTFRAGQNLPDKEFRYLRTVIVTAAVYWGFNSKLLQHSTLLIGGDFSLCVLLASVSLGHALLVVLHVPRHLHPLYMLHSIQAPKYAPWLTYSYLHCVISVEFLDHDFFLYRSASLHSLSHKRNALLSPSILRVECWITSPLNLPAPGRCQPLYISLRISRDLCFC